MSAAEPMTLPSSDMQSSSTNGLIIKPLPSPLSFKLPMTCTTFSEVSFILARRKQTSSGCSLQPRQRSHRHCYNISDDSNKLHGMFQRMPHFLQFQKIQQDNIWSRPTLPTSLPLFYLTITVSKENRLKINLL